MYGPIYLHFVDFLWLMLVNAPYIVGMGIRYTVIDIYYVHIDSLYVIWSFGGMSHEFT